ncbi:hypothetical protein M2271_003947 [Streptomyces sp. LBL]|nr:hypothetical protein [Streptomyces sp. LBL]
MDGEGRAGGERLVGGVKRLNGAKFWTEQG